ncbi:MAG: extracellular solute-binding protein [Clostridia bacterium]|jgi:putative aldouronate transport system substrate-binding protein|nr:extracellular solute-binding protein [Clostridia bacterium]
MKSKKIIGLLLVLSMMTSLVMTGCLSNKGTTAKPGEGNSKDDNFNASGYPIVKQKITFKIMLPGVETDLNQVKAYQDLEQKTNIHIEWDTPTYNQMEEKAQLMFASGNFVDAIGGWVLSDLDVTKYGPMGVMLPLEDLIDKYAPNVKKSFEDYPDAKAMLTLPDGHIYTLPIIGKQPPTRATTSINKVWLQKLGKPIPKTTDELYEVLKLFKTSDPNGNGKADEIPLSFIYNGGNNNDNYGMFGWFGIMDPSSHLIQLNKKVVWAPAQDGWKDAIRFFAKLWKEGLLDKEVFTHDGNQYQAKIKSDTEIFGVYSNWNPDGPGENGWKDYAYLPPLQSPNGLKPAWPNGDPWLFPVQAAILSSANKDGKDARALMRWIDEIYLVGTLKDGPAYRTNGPEGTGWERTPEGKIKYLDSSKKEPNWQKLWGGLPGWAWYSEFKLWENSERDEGGIMKDFTSGEVYGPYQGQQIPFTWLAPEKGNEASQYLTDLRKLTAETVARWISGQGDIDKEFDKYMEDCKKMGLDNLIKIRQEALDNYYKNKK